MKKTGKIMMIILIKRFTRGSSIFKGKIFSKTKKIIKMIAIDPKYTRH